MKNKKDQYMIIALLALLLAAGAAWSAHKKFPRFDTQPGTGYD
jgi:hypothetical protein